MYTLKRPSLKEIIESLGIPHTEVAQILLNNKELGFSFIPVGSENIDILSFSEVTMQSILRFQKIEDGLAVDQGYDLKKGFRCMR